MCSTNLGRNSDFTQNWVRCIKFYPKFQIYQISALNLIIVCNSYFNLAYVAIFTF